MRRDAAKQVDAATAALDRALAGFLEACALEDEQMRAALEGHAEHRRFDELTDCLQQVSDQRSEERRVGKECRSGWRPGRASKEGPRRSNSKATRDEKSHQQR